jgi:PAS domain-containing protein
VLVSVTGFPKKHPLLAAYGFAVAAVAIALVLSLVFAGLFGPYPFLVLYAAITLSAWYGGFGPGVLASVLSIAAVNQFFLYPAQASNISLIDITRLFIFILTVAILALIRQRQQKTMMAVHQSYEQMSLYLREMANGVMVQDKQGKLVYANYEAAKLMGFISVEALTGASMDQILAKFDILDEFGEPFPYGSLPARLALLGMQYPEAILRYRFKDSGKDRWSYVKARPIFNKQGEVESAISLFLDITELKETQQALTEQRILAEALRDTAEALTSSLDLAQVLDRILENVGRVTAHDAADIMLITGDSAKVARYRGYDVLQMKEMIATLELSVERTPTLKKMVTTGQPLLVSNTGNYSGWLKIPQMEWLHSYISFPLIIEGKVKGFLNLSSSTPNFFTTESIGRLQPFATQATIAIHNAQLYSEARGTVES